MDESEESKHETEEIDATDTLMMKYLTIYCYRAIEIDYIVYNGMIYYQRTNSLHTSIKDRPEHDPDVECSEHLIYPDPEDRCHILEDIFPDDNEVHYELVYNGNKKYLYDDDGDFIDDDDYDPKEDRSKYTTFLENIKVIGMENIILKNVRSIMLYNPSGRNNDHRGSDHCKIDLKYYKNYELDCPVTLKNFFEGLYRMKSHKWDNNYELFGECWPHMHGEDLHISLKFCHGS